MEFEEIFFQVLYVVVALFAHRDLTYEFSVPKYAIFSAGFLFLLVWAMIRLVKKREITLNLGHLLLFGFAAAALLSNITLYVDRPFYLRYSIDIALYTLLNAFAAVYITSYFRDKEKITRFLLVMIATAAFVSIDALYNFYTGRDFFLGVVGKPYQRASIKATIGNTIFVANYLGMVIPTTLYFIISRRAGAKEGFIKTLLGKVLAIFSLVLMIVTVIVSQTRSEYGGVFLTNLAFFAIYFLIIRKKRVEDAPKPIVRMQRVLMGVAAAAVAIFIVLYSVPSPLTGEGKFTIGRRVEAMFSSSSWDERILAWLSSYYQWKDTKVSDDQLERASKIIPMRGEAAKSLVIFLRRAFGRGIGTYQILTISYMGDIVQKHPRLIWGWNNFKRTHNDYFQVLGETGILGLFFIIALLVYLVVYYFRTLGKIVDVDDALLLTAMAMGFADFAIQSFFSFPGHLLPNALGAIFLASAALSDHFNKDGWMNFKLKLNGTSVVIVSATVLFIAVTSVYLRWNYFISEVNFKSGNREYLVLIKTRDLMNEILQQERTLEKYGDRYVKELDEKVLDVSRKLIGDRANDIWSKMSGRSPSEKFAAVSRLIYERAKGYLLRCLHLNRTYGKAYFYLASLAAWNNRIGDLLANMKSEEDYIEFFSQDFDEFQKLIHPSKKRTDLLEVWKALTNEEKTRLKRIFVEYQVILDSISLYETSLLVFNERNTYKALAQRFALLDKYSRMIKEILADKPDLVRRFDEMSEAYYEDFAQYARTIIHNIPGSWNRFPDWKNYDVRRAVKGQDIYRTMAYINFTLKDQKDREYQELLRWLAEKEKWACDAMRSRGVWGIPDMVFDFVRAVPYAYLADRDATSAALWLEYTMNLYSNELKDLKKELAKYSKKIDPRWVISRFADGVKEYVENWLVGELERAVVRSGIRFRSKNAIEELKAEMSDLVSKVGESSKRYLLGEGELPTNSLLNFSKSISNVEGLVMGIKELGELNSGLKNIASRLEEILNVSRDFTFKLESVVKDRFGESPSTFWVKLEEDRFIGLYIRDLAFEALKGYLMSQGLGEKDAASKAQKILRDVLNGNISGDVEKLAFAVLSLDLETSLRMALERNLAGLISKNLPSAPLIYPLQDITAEFASKVGKFGLKVDKVSLAARITSSSMKIYERYARFYGRLATLAEEAKTVATFIHDEISSSVYEKLTGATSLLKESLQVR